MKTFLLTFQSFTSPEILLRKLIERYHVPRNKSKLQSFGEFEKYRQKIQLRVCNILQQWTRKFPFDFVVTNTTSTAAAAVRAGQDRAKESLLLLQLLEFLEDIVMRDHAALAKNIRKHVMRLVLTETASAEHQHQPRLRLESTSNSPLSDLVTSATSISKQLQSPPSFPSSPAKDKWTISLATGKVDIFSVEPEEIAKQLTLVEFDLFSSIMVRSFMICVCVIN